MSCEQTPTYWALVATKKKLVECERNMKYCASILRGQTILIDKDQGTDVDKDTMIRRVADLLNPPIVERKKTNREMMELLRSIR